MRYGVSIIIICVMLAGRVAGAPNLIGMNMPTPTDWEGSDVFADAVRIRITEARAAARLMNKLHVHVASFYPGYKVDDRPWAGVRDATLVTLRELQALADDAGVVFAPEPHFATPLQTLPCIMEMLDAMPELRIAYDPSHFAMQGLDVRETELLLDRAVHVHVRDAAPDVMCAPCGAGTVDFAWLCGALAHRGYDGWMSVECLPKQDTDMDEQISAVRACVQRAYQST